MRELEEDKSEVSQRKIEEMGTHLDNVIGLFSGRSRRLTTSLTKRRMTSKAKADVDESVAAIAEIESDIQELGEDIQTNLEEIDQKWEDAAGEISQLAVKPLKKDIFITHFAITWLPFYRVEINGRESLLAAYELRQGS